LSRAGASEELMSRYTAALTDEIKALPADLEVSSVYIGGGTPTALPPALLLGLMAAVGRLKLAPGAEFTVEANPGAVDREYLRELYQSGANRLSLGLQSTDDALLRKMGRIHTYADFRANYEAARRAGFADISLDLMFALPFQTLAGLSRDLERVIGMSPEHVSAYGLTLEEGTPFAALSPLPDEEDRAMYALVTERLQAAGYEHYEISNFARPGRQARHNSAYWRRAPYLGLGLGAHSFFGGRRFRNTEDMGRYLETSGNNKEALQEISRAEAMSEFFFLGLRLLSGVDLAEFEREFGLPALDIYGDSIRKLRKLGLLKAEKDMLRLTPRGIDVSNRVFASFI
jgi:oxygen-independent coproporphyrinogen-3 oxidase